MKKNKTLIFAIIIVILIVILSLKPFYLFKRLRFKIDQLRENITTNIIINEGYIYTSPYALGEYYYFDGNNCIVNDSGHDNTICTIDVSTLGETGYVTVEGTITDAFDDILVTLNGTTINEVTNEVTKTDWFFKTPYLTKTYKITISLDKMFLNTTNKLQIIAASVSKTIEINFKK